MKKLILALGIAWLALFQGFAYAADFNWRFFGGLPTTHPYTKIIMKHLKEIREKSDGRLAIRYTYYGETPYKQMDALKLVNDGLADMTEWLPGNSGGTYPLLITPELPMLVDRMGTAAGLRDATSRAWDTPGMKQVLDDITDQHGAVVLSRYYYEPMNIWLTSPVSSLADLAGRKIRVLTPEHAQFISSIGASPVSIPQPEVYTSLQRKVLDGVITGAGNVKGSKFDEVLRTGYVANMAALSVRVLASEKKLDSLPEDLRKLVTEQMAALEQELGQFMPESDEQGQVNLEKGGMAISRMSDEDYAAARQLARDKVWAVWAERSGPQAAILLEAVEKAVAGQ